MIPALACPVLAVTGMSAEAGIARGHGVVTLAGGGDPARLALILQGALARGAGGVISFGVAGGLAPDLVPGTMILAEGIVAEGRRWTADQAWTERLATLLPRARRGTLAGVDRVAAGPAEKARLHRASGALAVDMESHIAARLATQHGVPFAALRVVADPAHRALPEAAIIGMRPDGSLDVRAVLGVLARHPGQLAALVRTALDAGAAFAVLRTARRQLPGALGFEAGEGLTGETGREVPRTERDTGLFGSPEDGLVENG